MVKFLKYSKFLFVIYIFFRGLAILSSIVMIVIVVLLWFCLFAAAPIGQPFEGVSLGEICIYIHNWVMPTEINQNIQI